MILSIGTVSSSSGTNWTAVVDGVEQNFWFSGATGEEQFANVRALQEAMSAGDTQALSDLMPKIFRNVDPAEADEVFQVMFVGTDEISYLGNLCFEAAEYGADDIASALAEAGEDLLLAMA